MAIKDAARLLRAYRHTTGRPIHIVRRELLSLFVPTVLRPTSQFVVGEVQSEELAVRTLIAANTKYDATVRPVELSEERLNNVYMAGANENAAFSAYVDLRREADVALHQEGDMRIAGLLAGVSAEALLDEVLLHLQWEGVTNTGGCGQTLGSGHAGAIHPECAVR